MDIEQIAHDIDERLHSLGTSDRAEKEAAYLKRDLTHYGVTVPDTRPGRQGNDREAQVGS